jgi:hypothetical protein
LAINLALLHSEGYCSITLFRVLFLHRAVPGSEVRLPISATDAINPALQHTKQQLIRPFRFAQWVRLAFVGLLAGELGSGGCNASFNLPATHQQRGSEQFLRLALPPQIANHPAMLAGILTSALVLALVLFVFFIYINSVMRFILFDSIVARECHIREGWSRRSDYGFRFFVWQILFMLASIAAFIALIGFPVACAAAFGWFVHPREHLLPLALGGVLCFLLLIVLGLALAVIHVMTKDFVVPQMALEDISANEGWRRLWSWLKAEKAGYGSYIGMKIVLAIGAGVAVGIVTVMVLLAVAIPIGGAGLIAVLAGKAAGWTWSFYTISFAVALGLIAFAIFAFTISLISVPVTVFFPAYSIYFLAPRYSPLAALLWPPPPAADAPVSASPDSPQMPPTLAPFG